MMQYYLISKKKNSFIKVRFPDIVIFQLVSYASGDDSTLGNLVLPSKIEK